MSRSLCPSCGGLNLIEDRESGELICAECGFVVSTIPDRGPEWREFGSRDRRERAGAPLTFLLHDMGLSTLIGEDGGGNTARLTRLVKKSIKGEISLSLIRALSEIHALSSKMGLPESVAENAALIYRRAYRRGIVAKKLSMKMAAASLYLSCRLFKIPKLIEDFVEASGIDKTTLIRCYRRLVKELKLPVSHRVHGLILSRLINRLELKGDVERLSTIILEGAREAGLTFGRKPVSMVAAAVYISTSLLGHRVSQRAVARASSITEVTLRNRYREILKKMILEVQVE